MSFSKYGRLKLDPRSNKKLREQRKYTRAKETAEEKQVRLICNSNSQIYRLNKETDEEKQERLAWKRVVKLNSSQETQERDGHRTIPPT